MSNFDGIEVTPQIQPAECSWGSGDASVNDFFFRMVNPDLGTSTLLMGHIFFKQLAKDAGYVQKSELDKDLADLRDELKAARDALDAVSLNIGDTRSALASLDSLESPLAAVRKQLGTFEKRLNERDAERSDASESKTIGAVEEPERKPEPAPAQPERSAPEKSGSSTGSAKSGEGDSKRASEPTAKPHVANVPSSGAGTSKPK